MSSFPLCELHSYASHRSPEPGWVQAAPLEERPVAPPAFLLGDLPAEMTYAFFAETRTGPVRCYRLRNVRLTADGIVQAGHEVLWSVLLNHPDYHVTAVMAELQAAYPTMPVRPVPGQAVMLSGPGSHIYGHWLIDILPRLYVLECCGYDLATLQYIVPHSLPSFGHDFLRLLQIGEHQVIRHDERREWLEVEDLLLPTNLRYGSQMHSMTRQAINFLRNRMSLAPQTTIRPGEGRRIFVSRRGGEPSRTLANRAEIEKVAEAEGYEIVCPETLTIPAQIDMFSSAAQVIGEYGSGLHGSVFAPPGTVVMALRGTSHHPGFIQSGLGQVLRHPTGYVFSTTPMDAVNQVFTASVEAFRLGLRFANLHARQASLGLTSP